MDRDRYCCIQTSPFSCTFIHLNPLVFHRNSPQYVWTNVDTSITKQDKLCTIGPAFALGRHCCCNTYVQSNGLGWNVILSSSENSPLQLKNHYTIWGTNELRACLFFGWRGWGGSPPDFCVGVVPVWRLVGIRSSLLFVWFEGWESSVYNHLTCGYSIVVASFGEQAWRPATCCCGAIGCGLGCFVEGTSPYDQEHVDACYVWFF
jgi:hypothetical protein